MFRPVVIIIRSLSFDTLKIILYNCVAAPHNYINNLKCVQRQRPDNGQYRLKHVVFWPRIYHLINSICVTDFTPTYLHISAS